MTNLSDSEISTKKLAAGITGIFLGYLGVHKFVLGYTGPAVIMLVLSLAGGVVTCGAMSFLFGVIGLIEGIIYLTKTNEEFKNEYLDGQKEWF